MTKNRILILFAHPAYQRSRANRWLVEAVKDLDDVTFRDLYELYPDFDIDVPTEQKLLKEHDVIVFHHPFYWYSSPALLKEWQDLVLEHGFAYGREGKALTGKQLLTVITTGGGADAYRHEGYNHYTVPELLQPFAQTADLCGMRYLPPFVVHGVHQHHEPEVMKQHADRYRKVLEGLRDGVLEPGDWEDVAHLHWDIVEDDQNA